MGSIAGAVSSVTQPISQLVSSLGGGSTASTQSSSSSSGASSGTAGVISGAQQSLASDQQTFLKLLTTQLKNQDPLSPMDTNQFTQQLVAMTGVQQQIVTNQLLQQLIGNQSSVGDPVGLVGKNVTATTDTAVLSGGKADWGYSLDAAAADVKLQVVNGLGNVVWQSDAGASPAGAHSLSWNGKDQNGNQLPDGGSYKLQVTATDGAGSPVSSKTYQQGVASQLVNDAGQNYLVVNGVKVPVSSVSTVGLAA